MIEIVAIVRDLKKSEYIETIEFDMDGGKPFCYRGRTSYTAFTDPTNRRNYNKRRNLLFYCKRKEDFLFEVSCWNRTMTRHSDYRLENIYDIPNVKLNSLWEFYEYIGYDYKNKKWKW